VFDSQIKHFDVHMAKFFDYWRMETETLKEVRGG
jgi:hypothetical protein